MTELLKPSQTQSLIEGTTDQRVHPDWDRWFRELDAIRQWVADNFTPALYGTMRGTDNLPAIGTGWLPITGYDALAITPRGILLDPTNGTFTFDHIGVYQLLLPLQITHNESNQSRTFDLRLFNTVDSTVLSTTTVGIARNQPVTIVTLAVTVAIEQADADDTVRLEIGNTTDTITVSASLIDININAVGEWREPLANLPG